jgi:hypothetical protein
MAMFYIWDCDRCEHKTLILLPVLLGIKGDPLGSPTDAPFVDFVCPQCGYARRRLFDELRQEEFESPPPDAIRFQIDLFHDSLKCEVEGCSAHARVHTTGETSTSGTVSKIAASEWDGMKGITCSLGHPVPVPVEPMPSVFP